MRRCWLVRYPVFVVVLVRLKAMLVPRFAIIVALIVAISVGTVDFLTRVFMAAAPFSSTLLLTPPGFAKVVLVEQFWILLGDLQPKQLLVRRCLRRVGLKTPIGPDDVSVPFLIQGCGSSPPLLPSALPRVWRRPSTRPGPIERLKLRDEFFLGLPSR
jgi:hypothetical protein